ncbi:MAG: amino acid permease, partial [bacterium]|nr:amino acid permease [bacterium]
MSTSNAQPPRRLSLFDSVCIIVGIVIGSGIYQTTPDIAFFTESMLAFLSVWVLGGLIAFSGALVY